MRRQHKIGVSFTFSGDDMSVGFDLPAFCTESERVENAEKLGAFLALINQGKLVPVVTYSLAKYGIVNQREPEAQHVLRSMHLAMGAESDILTDAPMVSPLDAFTIRRD